MPSMVSYISSTAIGVQQNGRYRLDRVLGEGAFGRVYLGFDEELQRQVAIKVPTKSRFQKPEDADDYLAEERMVASLDHPHIVPVYDMGRTADGSIYVVSKFIEGSTLDDRIKAGRFADSKRWTERQRAAIRKAARVHTVMWGGLMLCVLLLVTGIQQWTSKVRWKNLREQTRAAAESLQNNLGPTVPVNVKELGKLPKELVLPELQTRFASTANARHKLSLAFALAGYGEPDAEYLVSRIDDIAETDTRNFVTALQSNLSTSLAVLKAEARKCTDKPLWRRTVRLAIATLGVGDTRTHSRHERILTL